MVSGACQHASPPFLRWFLYSRPPPKKKTTNTPKNQKFIKRWKCITYIPFFLETGRGARYRRHTLTIPHKEPIVWGNNEKIADQSSLNKDCGVNVALKDSSFAPQMQRIGAYNEPWMTHLHLNNKSRHGIETTLSCDQHHPTSCPATILVSPHKRQSVSSWITIDFVKILKPSVVHDSSTRSREGNASCECHPIIHRFQTRYKKILHSL